MLQCKPTSYRFFLMPKSISSWLSINVKPIINTFVLLDSLTQHPKESLEEVACDQPSFIPYTEL